MDNDPYNLMKDQILKTRPEMAPMLELIESNNQSGNEKAYQETELLSDNQKLLKAVKRSKAINNKLLKVLQEFKADIEYQDNIMEQLANTLGACPMCFGYDSECDDCKGEGTPGTYSLNYKKLEILISKLLDKHTQLNNILTKN